MKSAEERDGGELGREDKRGDGEKVREMYEQRKVETKRVERKTIMMETKWREWTARKMENEIGLVSKGGLGVGLRMMEEKKKKLGS